MTLADKLIALNKALSILDNILIDAEQTSDVKVYSALYEQVNSVYMGLSQEWLDQNNQEK